MHLQQAVLVLHEEALHAQVEVQQEEVQLVEHGVECEMEFLECFTLSEYVLQPGGHCG